MRPWPTVQRRPLPPLPPSRSGVDRLEWEARAPVPVRPYRIARPRVRYTGPPSYPAPPRWGFPALVWRWPTALPGLTPAATPLERMTRLAKVLVPALYVLAGLAVLGAVGELWRYVLLVQSLFGPLSPGAVTGSDSLVITSSALAAVGSVLVMVFGVLWLLRAREAAERDSGLRPARPDWQLLAGTLVPGLNLAIPGSALAELEHTALGRSAGRRPTPSRLLLAWWGAWALGAVLFVISLLWYFRTGVQAGADGVLLHVFTDAVAAAVAVLSARVVGYLTALLRPVDPARARWLHVLRVSDAPKPPLRPERPAGSAR